MRNGAFVGIEFALFCLLPRSSLTILNDLIDDEHQ